MSFEAIFAMSQNRVIGKDGKIPWHIPEDFKFFKEITLGHRVIMGRKTLESIKKREALPKRENFVLTKKSYTEPLPIFDNQQFHRQGQKFNKFSIYQNISSLIQSLEDKEKKERKNKRKIRTNFVIGGAEIFQIFLPMIQKVYLSVIQKKFEGDTYLPVFEKDFELVENNPQKANIPFLIQTWKRKN